MSSVEPSGKQEYAERIRAVLNYIDTHLAEEMSVETLAGVACFSVFHFHRLFTAMMGESLSAYIRRLRLEWAANNLEAYREMSVTEIALNCGFSSSATFARAFKQHFGLSASAWRNTSGKNRQTKSKTGQAQSKPGKDSLPDSLYAVADRIPRVYPWMNEPGGGMLDEWK
jgi:AraC family transcriptional regulator